MSQTFQDLYREKLREIQRLWLDYVREILDRQAGNYPRLQVSKDLGQPANIDSEPGTLTLGYSDDGFPRLPISLDIDKLNKRNACALLRKYLAENYCE